MMMYLMQFISFYTIIRKSINRFSTQLKTDNRLCFGFAISTPNQNPKTHFKRSHPRNTFNRSR